MLEGYFRVDKARIGFSATAGVRIAVFAEQNANGGEEASAQPMKKAAALALRPS